MRTAAFNSGVLLIVNHLHESMWATCVDFLAVEWAHDHAARIVGHRKLVLLLFHFHQVLGLVRKEFRQVLVEGLLVESVHLVYLFDELLNPFLHLAKSVFLLVQTVDLSVRESSFIAGY